ncbi:DNA integrity scanning protein DisA [Candidatus Pacearchaeota archaeon]|nr:DNA integrity scanning protein DisA [Candidatus Pacearchaeota archaeon]
MDQELQKQLAEVPDKEIQETIIPVQQSQKVSEEEFFATLKTIAPGTPVRAGMDSALKAGKGALMVVENEQLVPIIDGGFRVNCRFTPQRFVELCKMDGAIIVSSDLKRINYANVMLTPQAGIKSLETGTRHKAAERTAKQIGTVVIAISERRHEVTLFYKNLRYPIKATEEIRRKANEQLQAIEKQRALFDLHVERLNQLELKSHPSLHKGLLVIQKGAIIQSIAQDMKRYIIELGTESTLLKARLKELIQDVEKETLLVIKDYTKLDVKKSQLLLQTLNYDELLETENLLKVLGYEQAHHVPIKGWRILDKTFLDDAKISEVIKNAGTLEKTVKSTEIHAALLDYEQITRLKDDFERIRFNT